jgi:hypothetical protein
VTEAPAPIIGSVDEFARVADLGLGRAVLFLRQHDAAPYRDALLYACTHYTAYDWQIEGRRTTYLYELVQAAGDAGSFVDSIVTALRETTSRRDADQLVSLMARFAEDGHTPARAAMYETLERDDTEEAFIGYDAIIDLDGLDGFLHVADRMGAAVLTVPPSLADDEHWKLTAALGDAEERCGKDRVRQALERAAMESSRIQAYIRSASAEEAKYSAPGRDRPALHDIPYEEIRQAIIGKEPGRFSRWALDLWGRAASDV